MFVQFRNHYREGWILVNTNHIICATPDRSTAGKDITLLFLMGNEEIQVAHSLDEVHSALEHGQLNDEGCL
jgi:hypothetical protein